MNEEVLIERVEEEFDRPDSEKVPLPRITELPNNFVEITESLRHISGRWSPVEIITPSVESRNREKVKLLEAHEKGEEYNPVFDYDVAENLDLEDSSQRLRELLGRVRNFVPQNQEERLARIALYFKIKDDIATTEIVKGIKDKDDERIGEAMKQKYPGVDDDLIEKAEEIYEQLCSGENKEKTDNPQITEEEQAYLNDTMIEAEGIKSAFEWALAQYGILADEKTDGFRVEITDKVTSIDVRDKASEGPTVFIPATRKVSLNKLLGLIAHEIEGHARQSVNGRKLFLIGGGSLMGDNDMLYEGLGMRYETRIREKLLGEKVSQPVPYFTFAVRDAENGASFYQIFTDQLNRRLHVKLEINPDQEIDISKIDDELLKKAKDQAFQTTYRVMRGHADTSNPHSYALAKDLAYLRGWMLDQDLIKIHAGFLNEAAVIHYKALKLIARFDIEEDDLPVPFHDVATKYWEEVLKPQSKTRS